MKKVMSIILIILAVIIVTFVVIDGSFLPRKYNNAWNDSKDSTFQSDVYKIINYSLGASSSHNMQPWLVKIINESTIELYADMEKQLPVIDGENKQLLMSQGAFIEKFKQGANIYGYKAELKYAEIDLNTAKPLIATVSITKSTGIEVDAISSSTVDVSNEAIDVDLDNVLSDTISNYDGFAYEYINSKEEMESIQKILLQGTVIESKDKAAMEELLEIFRWTEWEKNEYRYGLSLNSMPALLKPFVQPIMKLSSKNIEGFGNSSIKMFEDRLKNDIGYILIKKDNASSVDYISVGEIYQSLLKDSGNYSLRPAVQVLQDFEAMKDLGDEFQNAYSKDGEVLIIISVQNKSGKKTSSNPRHIVEDIIVE